MQSEYPLDAAMNRHEHPMDAARGLIAGTLIGLGTWAALIGAGILVWRFLL